MKFYIFILSLIFITGLNAKTFIGKFDTQRSPIKGYTTGAGVSVNKTKVSLSPPAKYWKGHWNAGQFKLPGNFEIILKAKVVNANPNFYLQAFGGKVLPKVTSVNDLPDNIKEYKWRVNSSKSYILSALWLEFTRKTVEMAEVEVLSMVVNRLRVKNVLNAKEILMTPPKHKAEFKELNGAITLFVDDKAVTGQMWSPMCIQQVSDKYLNDVLNGLNYSTVAFSFAIGENRLTRLFPTTWHGEGEYDWSFLDTQVKRILKARKDVKIILMLALDGAVWWSNANKEFANFEVDKEEKPRFPGEKGIPDYLSEKWINQQEELINQLVAYIQQAPWGSQVIGYELFNGTSMDCNFSIPHGNKRATDDFRQYLKRKYKTQKALQTAWQNKSVTFENAKPWTGKVPNGIILEPAKNQHFLDTRELFLKQFRDVFLIFASQIKKATHRRAIVGARTGDFFGNFAWNDKWYKIGEDSGWLMPLLKSSDFDYFDVQEPYPGRELGSGSGVPVLPVQAIKKYGKAIFIQNDVRTHLSKPGIGYGRTPDLSSTIQLQRRVFTNALINGTIPYLFQLNYGYNQKELLEDYVLQEKILQNALKNKRNSVAEVAIVFDPEMRLYLGSDDKYTDPARYFAIFDFTKHVWQRGGAPFDMIFLDQIENEKDYKVYIFYHTWKFSNKQKEMLKNKVFKDNKLSIFLWNDAIINPNTGNFDTKMLSELTGMNFNLSNTSNTWSIKADKNLFTAQQDSEVGLLPIEFYDPCAKQAGEWVYEPSITIKKDNKNIIPLGWSSDAQLKMAMKKNNDHKIIYNASGNIHHNLYRYALKEANVFEYIKAPSEAALMVNESYIGIHANKDEVIQLNLPSNEALVEVFSNKKYTKNSSHKINLKKNHTYLFERIKL